MAESEGLSEVWIPGSFELFYREDYASVVALAYALSGNRWVAEDLAQEAFLRAHREWARVGEMESPSGWVRLVALNLARSRLRRLRSEAIAKLRMSPAEATPNLVSDSESDAFWEEVRRLPTRQAQAIALRYIEDLSVTEIAEVLEIAEGTAKALLHQGRGRLRRQLSVKGLLDHET
ncbi:MAG: RNA polymerase sigma factor [Acidimicrobiia bacterium]